MTTNQPSEVFSCRVCAAPVRWQTAKSGKRYLQTMRRWQEGDAQERYYPDKPHFLTCEQTASRNAEADAARLTEEMQRRANRTANRYLDLVMPYMTSENRARVMGTMARLLDISRYNR